MSNAPAAPDSVLSEKPKKVVAVSPLMNLHNCKHIAAALTTFFKLNL